ncbi:odorant receptor 9a-like [Megachile rotundata]|uniref:odorant receptor 9a-like n=1 Tax=Megachile rotundata TaxID=143995 RepID=UPI003FD3E330
MDDQDLKVALGWNQRNMNVIGIWPDPFTARKHWDMCKVLAAILITVFFGVGPQSANLFFIWGDIELVTENLSTANIPGINVILKLSFAWYHKDTFKPVIKHFYDDWNAPKTEEERATMRTYAKSSNMISIYGSILTFTMETVFLSVRLITIMLSDKNQTSQDHLAIYPGYFPYDLRRTSNFVFTTVGQVAAGYLATIAYTTVDTFIAMLVIHLCGQFKILKTKLKRLMGDPDCGKDADLIQKELADIVKKHEYLNEFAAKIEECFNMLLLMQMLLCTIEFCFQGFLFFDVLLKGGAGMYNSQWLFFVFFVLLVLFVLVHIYIYCYIGEMILVQNMEMSNAAYESNWFNVSPREARCLLFIMNRSHRPLCLTAGKFSTFSMELFSTILKTAMGYLSVLLTVASSDQVTSLE